MSRVFKPHTGSWDSLVHFGLYVVKTSYMHANGASERSRVFRANVDGEGAADWTVLRVGQELVLVGKATNAHMFEGGE